MAIRKFLLLPNFFFYEKLRFSAKYKIAIRSKKE